ncbi:MAG: iron chelate uptake ABC transporter family permease subunit [Clostridiales bacterium]|jgi:iron complex transport system permease protein|nr:iron chelate uptake ABC transporter family permease subunit [Clostridiales bacterium]
MRKRVRAGVPSKKTHAVIFGALAVLLLAAVTVYIYSRTFAKSERLGLPMTRDAFTSITGRAVPHLIGMAASGIVIASVSLAFQTVTESRILTPSMIGFDSVFVGTQTLIVFFLGSAAKIFANAYLNYLISAGVMIVVSMLMYGAVLRKNKNNIVFLLMFGLILSGIIRSGASYLQVIMNANDFYQVRAATAVTVNNMNTDIIYLAAPLMLAVSLAMFLRARTYDVMSLGAANAKSLGVRYEREVNFNLIIISLGMSISTALIGSLTFLGLLAVNISREIFKTYKHSTLFFASGAVAALALIAGQAITELLQGAIPLTVVIDLAGCSYMFYLILKENKKV